jgi:electron-transferring-flavoprotein dehydrogenase
MKELWDIDPAKHKPGLVIHTQGWPLTDAYGGGFLYHQANGQVALGFVVGLSYRNPHLFPFEEFQRWKQHPEIRKYLEGGKRVSYGARAINEGGWQSIPKLDLPRRRADRLLGRLRQRAAHQGQPHRDEIRHAGGGKRADAVVADRAGDELGSYESTLRSSWIADELQLVKNAEPAVSKFGGTLGTILAGIDMWMRVLKIGLPITMKHKPDATKLWRKEHCAKIDYPKPDGVISFDRLSSVFLSNTNHEEDQPCHLQLKDPSIPISYNLPLYDEPAQRYCPAGVYEVVGLDEGNPRFQINAQNCVHCKTCDIKDPTQNINWVTPEGGGGPNYPNM